ncbi:Os03g0308900 [Oryza sativa Japonica Group]|uniref:Os03g0308900 protein n=1 Tax=Oryza sativa subsp. japonica TaxID=39947 RepID=Q0DSG6_ORYSJ|nr:Os03g0308900 [Oryza sativa Japonica Group]|eukprot:NP_001049908.1 Os03g0308900 [Oryza sativa Japonica Group]
MKTTWRTSTRTSTTRWRPRLPPPGRAEAPTRPPTARPRPRRREPTTRRPTRTRRWTWATGLRATSAATRRARMTSISCSTRMAPRRRLLLLLADARRGARKGRFRVAV